MSRIKVQYPVDASLGEDSGKFRWLDPIDGKLYVTQTVRAACRTMRPTAARGEWGCVTDSGRRVNEVDLAKQAGPPPAPSGLKHDGGKPRWSLLMRGCADALQAVVRVLTFGAQKYADDSWKGVQNGQQRYRDALYRHLNAIERGEFVDDESGEAHWAHVATNALFLYELHKQEAP